MVNIGANCDNLGAEKLFSFLDSLGPLGPRSELFAVDCSILFETHGPNGKEKFFGVGNSATPTVRNEQISAKTIVLFGDQIYLLTLVIRFTTALCSGPKLKKRLNAKN